MTPIPSLSSARRNAAEYFVSRSTIRCLLLRKNPASGSSRFLDICSIQLSSGWVVIPQMEIRRVGEIDDEENVERQEALQAPNLHGKEVARR